MHSALAMTMKHYTKVSAADEQIGQRSFLKRPAALIRTTPGTTAVVVTA